MEKVQDIAIVGHVVEFTDEHGVPHDALLTYVHGNDPTNATVNLVFVTGDENSTDQYGRQIVRKTSVAHKRRSTAHGYFWSGDVYDKRD